MAKTKEKKSKGMTNDEMEEEVDEIEEMAEGVLEKEKIKIKASRDISEIKKGDKIKVDGKEYEVDAHYVLMEHKTTKEMAIELFDKDDSDYQLRYFNDNMDTMEFYELQGGIMYVKKRAEKVEW